MVESRASNQSPIHATRGHATRGRGRGSVTLRRDVKLEGLLNYPHLAGAQSKEEQLELFWLNVEKNYFASIPPVLSESIDRHIAVGTEFLEEYRRNQQEVAAAERSSVCLTPDDKTVFCGPWQFCLAQAYLADLLGASPFNPQLYSHLLSELSATDLLNLDVFACTMVGLPLMHRLSPLERESIKESVAETITENSATRLMNPQMLMQALGSSKMSTGSIRQSIRVLQNIFCDLQAEILSDKTLPEMSMRGHPDALRLLISFPASGYRLASYSPDLAARLKAVADASEFLQAICQAHLEARQLRSLAWCPALRPEKPRKTLRLPRAVCGPQPLWARRSATGFSFTACTSRSRRVTAVDGVETQCNPYLQSERRLLDCEESDEEAHSVFLGSNSEIANELENERQELLRHLQSLVEAKVALLKKLKARLVAERPETESLWRCVEQSMLELYRKEFFNQSLSSRHAYTLARQYRDLDVVRLLARHGSELPGWWTDEALCSVCGNRSGGCDDGTLMFCDACFLPAHHACLAAHSPQALEKTRKLESEEAPAGILEEDWYCPCCRLVMSQISDPASAIVVIRHVAGVRFREEFDEAALRHPKAGDLPATLVWHLPRLLDAKTVELTTPSKKTRLKQRKKVKAKSQGGALKKEDKDEEDEEDKDEEDKDEEDKDEDRAVAPPASSASKGSVRSKRAMGRLMPEGDLPHEAGALESARRKFCGQVHSLHHGLLWGVAVTKAEVAQCRSLMRREDAARKRRRKEDATQRPECRTCSDPDVFTASASSADPALLYYTVKIPCCSLCGYDCYFKGGGIISKGFSSRSNDFVHVRCALGIRRSAKAGYVVEPERRKLKCCFCSQKGPAPVQCSHEKCPRAYHVPCATQALECVSEFVEEKPTIFCFVHSKEKPPTNALRAYQQSVEKQKKNKKRLQEERAPFLSDPQFSSWFLRSLVSIHNVASDSLDFLFPPSLARLLSDQQEESRDGRPSPGDSYQAPPSPSRNRRGGAKPAHWSSSVLSRCANGVSVLGRRRETDEPSSSPADLLAHTTRCVPMSGVVDSFLWSRSGLHCGELVSRSDSLVASDDADATYRIFLARSGGLGVKPLIDSAVRMFVYLKGYFPDKEDYRQLTKTIHATAKCWDRCGLPWVVASTITYVDKLRWQPSIPSLQNALTTKRLEEIFDRWLCCCCGKDVQLLPVDKQDLVDMISASPETVATISFRCSCCGCVCCCLCCLTHCQGEFLQRLESSEKTAVELMEAVKTASASRHPQRQRVAQPRENEVDEAAQTQKVVQTIAAVLAAQQFLCQRCEWFFWKPLCEQKPANLVSLPPHPSLLGACVLCNRCDGFLVRSQPLPGSAASPASELGDQWVHPCCAEWFVTSKLKGKGISCVARILRKYGSSTEESCLTCSYCCVPGGAVWTCSHPACSLGFHVSCGRLWGSKFESPRQPAPRRAFCREHSLPASQVSLLASSDAEWVNWLISTAALSLSCWSACLTKSIWERLNNQDVPADICIQLIQAFISGIGCLSLVFAGTFPSLQPTAWVVKKGCLGSLRVLRMKCRLEPPARDDPVSDPVSDHSGSPADWQSTLAFSTRTQAALLHALVKREQPRADGSFVIESADIKTDSTPSVAGEDVDPGSAISSARQTWLALNKQRTILIGETPTEKKRMQTGEPPSKKRALIVDGVIVRRRRGRPRKYPPKEPPTPRQPSAAVPLPKSDRLAERQVDIRSYCAREEASSYQAPKMESYMSAVGQPLTAPMMGRMGPFYQAPTMRPPYFAVPYPMPMYWSPYGGAAPPMFYPPVVRMPFSPRAPALMSTAVIPPVEEKPAEEKPAEE